MHSCLVINAGFFLGSAFVLLSQGDTSGNYRRFLLSMINDGGV